MSAASTPPRLWVIGNPISGRGAGTTALLQLDQCLRAREMDATFRPTAHPAHAIDLAREAAEAGATVLIVVGGDGTIRDVVEGLTLADALPRTAVCILPAGTGNDLARSVPSPADPEGVIAAVLGGEEARVDVWRWDNRVFLNVAGVGLDAAVAEEANHSFRRLRGTLAYLAAFCRVLPRFKPLPLSLTWPGGEWEGAAWLAAFGNGSSYGGGMRITPGADPQDGLLDVVVVEAVPKLELLAQFPRIFSGTHLRHPRVRSFRVPAVEIRAPNQPATLDGEVIARTPATITRVEQPLRVLVPPR